MTREQISEEILCQQVVRLSVLRNRPDCIDEVIYAFRESAKNAAHAARMAEWTLRYSQYFPTPAEVYDAAVATFREEDMRHPDRHCPVCDGTGWEQGWVLETRHKTPGGGAYVSSDRLKSREKADQMQGLVDGRNQIVWMGVRPCSRCQHVVPVPAPPPTPSTRKKAKMLAINEAELLIPEESEAE